MYSNRSRGTLMSYSDHSVQRRFKSNAPFVYVGRLHVCLSHGYLHMNGTSREGAGLH